MESVDDKEYEAPDIVICITISGAFLLYSVQFVNAIDLR